MLLQEFKDEIIANSPTELAEQFLRSDSVAAFETPELYAEFQAAVTAFYPDAEAVSVAGTANWLYSLNPKKNFKTYDARSDVDTIVVSLNDFTRFWDEIRLYHRTNYYQLHYNVRQNLLRNGQNVYSGFVTPSWIPDKSNQTKYQHKRVLNQLTDKRVDFRPVKMFFFRNWDEVIDYYTRGFRIAKGTLTK